MNVSARVTARLGYLAVWPAFYQAGLVVATYLLLGESVSIRIVLASGLLAVSVYLLDRVKPTDALLDEADKAAHPQRSAFLLRTPGLFRSIIASTGIGAAVMLYAAQPIAMLLVPAGWFGVLVYGSWPRRPRPKDVLVLKNLAVAIAMSALALVLVMMDTRAVESEAQIIVAVFLVLCVMSDAMICDIDDREADARFGTVTIANRGGVAITWALAILLQALAVLMILFIAPGQRMVGLLLGGGLLLGTLTIRLVRPSTLRDLVEIRLAVVVGLAWTLSVMVR